MLLKARRLRRRGHPGGRGGPDRAIHLLKARRLRRRGHPEVLEDEALLVHCSKPEGFVVGVTVGAQRRADDPGILLKARRLRRRGHTRGPRRPHRPADLLKARRLRRRGHSGDRRLPGRPSSLLKARRLRRRGHEAGRGALPPARGLLKARRLRRRGHAGGRELGDGPLVLLKARRLRRRGHGRSRRWRTRARSAQSPKASSSGSPERGPHHAQRQLCSKPEGFVVGVTGRPEEDQRVGGDCSKPEGFVVGVTRVSLRSLPALRTAQSPKASSSGSRRSWRREVGGQGCSKPEGFVVGVTRSPAGCPPIRWAAQSPKASSSGSPGPPSPRPSRRLLLKARRLRRRGHEGVGGRADLGLDLLKARRLRRRGHDPQRRTGRVRASAAQSPKASSSGSRWDTRSAMASRMAAQSPKASSSGSQLPGRAGEHQGGGCSKPEGFVVGVTVAAEHGSPGLRVCSKPEGFVVGVTRRRGRPSASAWLLKARRLRRRGHTIAPGTSRVARAAQSPKASSSGSPAQEPTGLAYKICSKPEGFVVGVTAASRSRCRWASSAQSPKASSSGSRAGAPRRARPGRLLKARRLRRRGHGGIVIGAVGGLRCSKPEGFVVGVTRWSRAARRRSGLLKARRLRRRGHRQRRRRDRFERMLLKARRLRRRGHRSVVSAAPCQRMSAQSPKASSSGSLESQSRADSGSICSKPEGFVVGVTFATSAANWSVRAAQSPKASSSGSRPARNSLRLWGNGPCLSSISPRVTLGSGGSLARALGWTQAVAALALPIVHPSSSLRMSRKCRVCRSLPGRGPGRHRRAHRYVIGPDGPQTIR